MPRYASLIPCYNVGNACIPIVEGAAARVELCIAVDDGSTDNTLASMKEVTLGNAKIIRHETNKGKGAALITGFRTILDNHPEIDAVITLDGDGQHDPSLIIEFQRAFEQTGACLIYGNRMADTSLMPRHRRWLNNLSNRIISRVCKQPIADSQCGYRLYTRELLKTLIDRLKSDRYELETELLIYACRQNFKISSVPVPALYSRATDVLSHHSLTDVLRIAGLIAHFYKAG